MAFSNVINLSSGNDYRDSRALRKSGPWENGCLGSLFFTLLPVLGCLLYLIFGRKTQGPLFRHKHIPNNHLDKTVRQQQTDFNQGAMLPPNCTDSEQKLTKLLLHSGFAPMTIHNQVDILLNGGEKFQALFNALEGAKITSTSAIISLKMMKLGKTF